MRRVTVGAHAGIGEGHAVTHLNDRRHFLQIDLVHDAVAGRDHIDVLERELGPVDEVEAVLVATEHLDRNARRKLERRLRCSAHLSDDLSRVHTPPSATPLRTTSGVLASVRPSKETSMEPTEAPAATGATRLWSRPKLAFSNA